jgi:type I site-specific restriction endonuclease
VKPEESARQTIDAMLAASGWHVQDVSSMNVHAGRGVAVRELPLFRYLSTGVETRFANHFDPEPRSRNVFSFHRPETHASWISDAPSADTYAFGSETAPPSTLRHRLRGLPPLDAPRLWRAQVQAVRNLEASLAEDRPRALIQMATGSGKTFTVDRAKTLTTSRQASCWSGFARGVRLPLPTREPVPRRRERHPSTIRPVMRSRPPR